MRIARYWSETPTGLRLSRTSSERRDWLGLVGNQSQPGEARRSSFSAGLSQGAWLG